jgi:hypothetical protein
MDRRIRVALAGNPNSGKTTLFNQLTGARQHVGNYPGVTVEKKEGSLRHGDLEIKVVDLPSLPRHRRPGRQGIHGKGRLCDGPADAQDRPPRQELHPHVDRLRLLGARHHVPSRNGKAAGGDGPSSNSAGSPCSPTSLRLPCTRAGLFSAWVSHRRCFFMEQVAVCLIVGIVGFLSVRSLYRTFTGKDDTCGCAGDCRRCGKPPPSEGVRVAPMEGDRE